MTQGLPDGTPLLVIRDGRFALTALRDTSRLSANASQYTAKVGHEHVYVRDDLADRVNVQWTHESSLLRHRAGFLQSMSGNIAPPNPVRRPAARSTTFSDAAVSLGMGAPRSRLRAGAPATTGPWFRYSHWVRPITPIVQEVFDTLGVFMPERADTSDADRSKYLYGLLDGSVHRVANVLRTLDLTALDAEIRDAQRRWFSGAQVHAPYLHVYARSGMTTSKLTKAMRELIARTGVEWPARTSASEYVRLIVKEHLMYDNEICSELLAGPVVVAVGGVKGGVDKSTVAAALATALARSGRRTVLYDADVEAPSQHLLWELGDVPISEDLTSLLPAETSVPDLRVFSPGQVAGLPTVWSEASVVDWMTFTSQSLCLDATDVLVVDLPAGISAVSDLLLGSVDQGRSRASVVVTVATADVLSLSDASRSLVRRMHERYQRVVIENMSTATGAGPDGRPVTIRLRGEEGQVQRFAEESKAAYAGSLPWSLDAASLATSDAITRLVEAVPQVASGR